MSRAQNTPLEHLYSEHLLDVLAGRWGKALELRAGEGVGAGVNTVQDEGVEVNVEVESAPEALNHVDRAAAKTTRGGIESLPAGATGEMGGSPLATNPTSEGRVRVEESDPHRSKLCVTVGLTHVKRWPPPSARRSGCSGATRGLCSRR